MADDKPALLGHQGQAGVTAVAESVSSCGKATAPAQPSVRPIPADSHFGAWNQNSFNAMATSAPPQTTASTGIAQPFDITIRAKGA